MDKRGIDFGQLADPAVVEALVELTARLRHDLGKYITMQQRWLGGVESLEERASALSADLLATRKSDTSVTSALVVWAEFEPFLIGESPLFGELCFDFSDDPDVSTIRSNFQGLGDVIDSLGSGHVGLDAVERGERMTREIADACRSLCRRARLLRQEESEWRMY